MKITKSNLRECLRELLMSLNKGERVRIDFDKAARAQYLDLQMKGLFKDLLCTTDSYGRLYIGRAK